MIASATFLKVWAIPVALGVLTLFGLFAALLGTGLWHWCSWACLTIPVVVALRYWAAPRA
jgi:hypothetical protein